MAQVTNHKIAQYCKN